MITGSERLRAAGNGEILDRIPVFCTLLDQGAKLSGVTLKEYYSRGDLVAEAQIRMREKYGYDNLWSLFYVGKEAELLGCKKIIYSEYGPPNVEDFIIKNYKDIELFEVPDSIIEHPDFKQQKICLDILQAESNGKYPICAYLTSSMTLPSMLMGMEKWIELLLLGPAELRDMLLTKCSDFFKKEIEAYRSLGATVLIYSNPFGSSEFLPIKMIKDFVIPWMNQDLQEGGIEGVVYYCGSSRMLNIIDDIIHAVGLRAFYVSPFDDISKAKNIIGSQGLTCGVINDIPLVRWSEEEIKNEVEKIIMAGKPGFNFLFGTLVMPLSIPDRNIICMLEAAYNYGKYLQ